MSNRYGLTPPSTVTHTPHARHDPQQVFESPTGHMRLVIIEKCMSTLLREWCQREGWRPLDRFVSPSARPHVVVLRDPVERWCSGIRMYLHLQGWDWHREPPALARRVIEDCMVMDQHTEPQSQRLAGLRLAQIRAVDMAREPHRRLNELLATDFFRPTTRDTHPLPVWLEHSLAAGLRDRIHQRYREDHWLRLWLLDVSLPWVVLAQRDAT